MDTLWLGEVERWGCREEGILGGMVRRAKSNSRSKLFVDGGFGIDMQGCVDYKHFSYRITLFVYSPHQVNARASSVQVLFGLCVCGSMAVVVSAVMCMQGGTANEMAE
jgi:hypothetical protein